MSYQPTYFKGLPKSQVLDKRESDGVDPYVFDERIAITVDVALATSRPLLVSGNPGCGKSRLADAIAVLQGWNLLTTIVTSRTRLESLTAEVDQIRRLNDAQAKDKNGKSLMKPDECYLSPGIFWWAFQPQTAGLHGLSEDDAQTHNAKLPYPGVRRVWGDVVQPTVLLIDEIDKAEPDLPNDLLEPLDRRRFDLPEGFRINDKKQIGAPNPKPKEPNLLTVITTNRERELPQAFLRRCVQLQLSDPEENKLIEIGTKHFPPGGSRAKLRRIKEIAALIDRFRKQARDSRLRAPGTAEFLDAIRACDELGIMVDEDEKSVWRQLERAVLDKDGQLRKTPS